MADLDSTEVRQRTSDIREWIFEAVDKIGAPMQYISKESGADGVPVFPIQDNQIPIPADLVVLDGVAFSETPNGPWVPVQPTTSIFKEPKRKHLPFKGAQVFSTPDHDHENYAIEDHTQIVFPHQPPARKRITSQSQFYGVNTTKYLDRLLGKNYKEKPEYFIKPGWMVINKPKGFIKLAYKAIATDERGYPLIPDLTSYQEAIYWYVMMKLNFKKFLNGKLGGGRAAGANMQIYQYLQNQWEYYKKQAYGEAMMPNEADMRGIKNEWTKLIPDWDSDEFLFKNEGRKQLNYTDYYYGY